MNIILASGSPRRRQLLAQASVDFSIMAAEIDESVVGGETPQAYISRMVAQKAQAALAVLNTANTPNDEYESTALHQPLLQQSKAAPCKPWYQGRVPYPKVGLSGGILEGVRALHEEE